MKVQYSLGLLMLVACFLTEVSSRPSNNESAVTDDASVKEPKAILDTEEGSIAYQADTDINIDNDSTRDIVEKIKTINSFLSKPSREQINYNKPYYEKAGGIDKETLERIQQIIASAKPLTKTSNKNSVQTNSVNDDDGRSYHSRSANVVPKMLVPNPVPAYMPYPYIMNVPVMPTPYTNMLGGYDINNNLAPSSNDAIQSRQGFFQGFPSLPSFPSFSFDNFQLQPFSQYFPVLIKNPVVALAQGGGWQNFIEYGQNADVCNRKQKSSTDESNTNIEKLKETLSNHIENLPSESKDSTIGEMKRISRQSRALKKRTVSSKAAEQEIDEDENDRKIYPTKTITRKKTKKPVAVDTSEDLKYNDPEGDLRLPFSDFTWFGHKKPVAPSPGFFINKLKVHRGGVAIAGPGGVATAGKGGTAIVGPGGVAYTKPGGLAIAGPHARVVALSPYADPLSLIHRPHHHHGYDFRSLDSIREGKLVAMGPIIYYHPTE